VNPHNNPQQFTDVLDFALSSGRSGIWPFLANPAKSSSGKISGQTAGLGRSQHSCMHAGRLLTAKSNNNKPVGEMVSSLYGLVDVIRCVSAWRPISFRAGGQMVVVPIDCNVNECRENDYR